MASHPRALEYQTQSLVQHKMEKFKHKIMVRKMKTWKKWQTWLMKKCVFKLFLDRKGQQRMKTKCKAALTKMTIQVDPWGTKSFRICIHRRRRCCGRTIRDRLLLLAKLNCNGSGKTFETVKQLSVHKKHNFTEPGKVRRALNLHRESLTCPDFLGVLVIPLKFVIQTPVSLERKWRNSTCQNS